MSEFSKASGLYRRDFFRTVAAAGLATLAPMTVSGATPSETEDAVSRQPTPGPGDDWNTSDILIETLIDWGATHVFGIVGDGINSIIEALRKRQDRIRYIAVRHEEAAAFMASGTPVDLASALELPVRAPSICSMVSTTLRSTEHRWWR